MLVLKATDLQKEWNGVTLFEQVSFEVREGERIALVGRNGVGKTTLLQGLYGQIPFDSGSIQRVFPLEEWGWLEQEVETKRSLTLLEFMQSGSTELFQLKQTLEYLQMNLGLKGVVVRVDNIPDNNGLDQVYEEVMSQYSQVYNRYLQLDGYGWEIRVEKCLQQMKLEPSLWSLPFNQLSGGQKTRTQLASLIVREPKFVILDEPTNHLDANTLDWLEQWMQTYSGTILYVSHDRTFIDRTATAVMELDQQGCRRYTGGYTDYRSQKELEMRTQESLYKKQEQQREKLLESIRRYSEWFHKSHNAAGQNDFYRSKAKKNVSRLHAKEAALERLDREQAPKLRDPAQLSMQLTGEVFAASTLLKMEDIVFSYDGVKELLSHFNLSVNREDRIAVMGSNGTGKSTLMKLIAGISLPSSGDVHIHPQTKIGYFAQEHDNLELNETILDSLLKLPEMTQSHARTILGCFMFSKEDVFKKIGALSMGEKSRVAFLKLYFGHANLLVLDEPTNYLDIDTRERVEEALLNFPGALLLVTHDRYLIRKVANRLVIMNERGNHQLFQGNYDEYFSKDRSRSLTEEERRNETECAQLELQLAQLMSSKEPEEYEERQELMRKIKQIGVQISKMKKALTDRITQL